MSEPKPTPTSCAKCATVVTTTAKFCPQCGWQLGRSYAPLRLSARAVVVFGTVTVGIFAFGWFTHRVQAGVKPTKPYRVAAGHTGDSFDDPEINRLRTEAEADKGNIQKLDALAQALIEQYSEIGKQGKPVPPPLIFETLDVLGELLKHDPQHTNALITIANISFNQKVFDKAAEYYTRYLSYKPNDLAARSRYGSTLTLMGKADDAVNELQSVLKVEPNDFHATAYLAIAYRELGDEENLDTVAKRALALAPSEEARTRLRDYLAKPVTRKAVPSSSDISLPAVVAYVRSNPIAGPKYARYEQPDPQTITIYLNDFPMDQMPPFAKEKFFNGLKDTAEKGDDSITTVVFLDAASGRELDRLSLQ